ncbi:uncharacterized protein LOC124544910 isoform X1 [Schistocerca americana]|uniref:uncharacterized protein LOC124544910 isoform X1 n=1 Tax=Schistocerca americana TaxID=7009 RepID=UPI001F4FE14D|nr:uncharacterized protein LOC124544910 isoform X1 [Schistocerca americana]
MVSKCVNRTLFLYRDGVRLHRMKFYIYECAERDALKAMIQERCGIVVETKGEHVVCFARQCQDLEDGGELFSTEYIKQCCENNVLLDLKKFRLGKKPDCSNVDPLEVLKGIASWPKNMRCLRNSNQNNSVNKVKETRGSELLPQKRKWREAYSREEDVNIIRYLLKNNNYKKAGTNTLWKEMELQEVLRDRSWQSMKNRLRIIRLHPERYDLSDEDIRKLGGETTTEDSNSLTVSVSKGKCCFCCPKMALNGCEVANESENVRCSCHCSQRMKIQAGTAVGSEALVQVESIGRKFSCSVQSQAKQNQESYVRNGKPLDVKQCHTNSVESFSCASSRHSDDEIEMETEPKRCFRETSSPFHKTKSRFTVKDGAQPNHRRKLYILPSSDINVSVRSGDISLIKKNSVHKKFSIPLRWPQIFTPVNSAGFDKQVTESDTVAPETLNNKARNQNSCPDDNGSTVYGSCHSYGNENGSAAYSSKGMLGEGTKSAAAVDYLRIVKHTHHSSKTKETLPDKGQKPLNVRSHSTPKKAFQVFNKTESRFVNNSVYILERSKAKSMQNRMEIEEGIVSPSFSTSSTSSGLSFQMNEEKSTNHVNDCINSQMSSEYRKLQTSDSNEVQCKSQFEITNILYSNRHQDEESPATQHSTVQDVRPVPEKDKSSSPAYHQKYSNSKRHSLLDRDKHCQHVSNYKDFYVKQWLNSVVHYYENGNISKLPSFSEKLKEITTSSESDNHYCKNNSCNNLNGENSCAATYINKSFCVQKEVSKIDEQVITESRCGAKESNSVVNSEFISSHSNKSNVLKDKLVCVIGASERVDFGELSHSSSVEDSRKMTVLVPNVTETPDRNDVDKRIAEPLNRPTAAGSKGDSACRLQSYAGNISSVNNENSRTEPFLQISHVTSLCCVQNQVQCSDESCDSGDVLVESQTSQASCHLPVPIKQELSISIEDEVSLLDDEGGNQSSQVHTPINQETSRSTEDEELRYEGYSPPVDFVTHVSDNE